MFKSYPKTAMFLSVVLLAPCLAFADPMDPADHVVLTTHLDSSMASDCGFSSLRRMSPDGSEEDLEFRVPEGKMLVLTDISWSATPDPALEFYPGRFTRMYLESQGPNGDQFIYQSNPTFTTDENRRLRLGGNENLTTGILVGPNQILCPRAYSSTLGSSITNTVVNSFFRGYFITVKSPQTPSLP